jgi:oxygen-independent coproporphyrinogen-3 oxidase
MTDTSLVVTPARPTEGPCAAARHQARRGLYVHVPFCAVRCAYCDFATGALSSGAVERYLSALAREAERRAPHAAGTRFTSVFFGGGTPSALSARHFAQLWSTIARHFEIALDAEITLEANPESARPALLEAWARAGVNRLSMGVQSFDAEELATLGRIHDARRPAVAVAEARAAGFERLSLDLMFGFPRHRMETWTRTLERALELSPEHLSAYCYIPELDTPMGRSVLAGGGLTLPEPEEQADLYDALTERLAAAGYGAYEISNFCRRSGEARHNLVYWLRRDYLGLGPSAHGLWRGERYGNHPALDAWAGTLERGERCDQVEPESARSRADEIVMLGLRLMSGLRRADYPAAVWSQVASRYGAAFVAAEEAGRLVRTRGGWKVPRRARFLSDDAIAWVMARADPAPFDTLASPSVPSEPCPDRPFQAA